MIYLPHRDVLLAHERYYIKRYRDQRAAFAWMLGFQCFGVIGVFTTVLLVSRFG